MTKHVKKHDSFLELLKEINPHAHSRIMGHPKFDPMKHNSLYAAALVDGPLALSLEDCLGAVNAIDEQRQVHGDKHAYMLKHGRDPSLSEGGIWTNGDPEDAATGGGSDWGSELHTAKTQHNI